MTSSIAPLERFVAPLGLCGRDGEHRFDFGLCTAEATNDIEAIIEWLNGATRPTTRSAYRQAAEKLLNWCCFEQGIAVSSMQRSDLLSFANFLFAPFPTAEWTCPRGTKRDDEAWRPFCGPLSLISQRLTISAISSLFEWMNLHRYAEMPGLVGFRSANIAPNRPTLSMDAWCMVMAQLADNLDETSLEARLFLELCYFAKLSLEDMRYLRTCNVVMPSDECPFWRLLFADGREVVYLLPPVAKTLSIWCRDCLSSRAGNILVYINEEKSGEYIFPRVDRAARGVRKLLERAASRASARGFHAAALELRECAIPNIRAAIENHGIRDCILLMHFTRRMRWENTRIALYVRFAPLEPDDIVQILKRLEYLWNEYPLIDSE
jgi:hypothetical protein